ncbi:hypothetical protein [Flavobacterium sp.]|jgi:hypothetical protein|uniref:hypothetical protein n=1 Tax=Flavobacterium sp. TaxID=239 RepID=UPI0037BF714B
MSSFISVMNLRANRAMPLNRVLNTTNKFTLLLFEPMEEKLHPECIKISITEEEHSEEFTIDLNYNATLKAYDFHQVNRTFYPKFQSIKVEVVVNEEDIDKDLKYSFTLIIKEDSDDDGDGYFIKIPKSSPGKTVSSKHLEKVE